MKRKIFSAGFWISFLINLAVRCAWIPVFLILLILYFVFRFPLWIVFIPLVLWFVHAFIVTFILSLLPESEDTPPNTNKNPYSARSLFSAGKRDGAKKAEKKADNSGSGDVSFATEKDGDSGKVQKE